MMTPKELKDYCFGTSLKGYNITEVDDFLGEVGESYEKLYNDNAELQKKIDFLLEKIEGYREDEESLKSAIVNAQKMADSVSKDAQRKADRMLREAELKSERIVAACKHTVDAQRFEYNRLRREISDFREQLMGTYRRHLEQIKDLPAFEDESDYPETMEDAVRLAEGPQEPEAPETAAEPVSETAETVPETAEVPEPEWKPEPVAEKEIPDLLAGGDDTVEFRRQPEEPIVSKGVVGEEDEELASGEELRFGPGYDLSEEERPRGKRRSIFGRRREED